MTKLAVLVFSLFVCLKRNIKYSLRDFQYPKV